jgi:PmbA protein
MSEAMTKTEDIVKKGKTLGADEVIASTVFAEYRQSRFSNNQVDIGVAWNDYTTNILLTWKNRIVATQIKNFQNITPAMERLFKLAKVSQENPMWGGLAKGKFKYAKPMADKAIRDIKDPSGYIYEAIDAAKKHIGKNIDAGGILFTKYEQVFLISSEGPEGKDERSTIELSIRAFANRDESGHSVECGSSLKGFKPARAGDKAGEIAKMANSPKPGKTGKYDIIFDPLFFGSMLGAFGYMGSAFSVMTKMSVFVDKLGAKVGPNILTVRDNPAKYSMSNRIFDDEGVPVKETVFIDKGVLKTYFHNTSTAKIFKTKTTGHAGIIQPSPWSLEVDAGTIGKDEMFKDVKKALYLTNTWYTRFQNYATGDFSTIPRDGMLLVENGKVKESWKEIRLSDNIQNLFKNIMGISKERQHVHWWAEADPPSLSPYVLAKNIQITRPE